MKSLEKIKQTEEVIVGILLLWPELAYQVPLNIDMFWKYKPVVMEILNQLNKGLKPDLLTITDAFPDNKDLLYDLGSLAKNCPSGANYVHYVKKLADLTDSVEIYKKLEKALQQIVQGGDTKQILGKIITETLSMPSQDMPKTDWAFHESVAYALERLEQEYENRGDKSGKVFSGIEKLDRHLGPLNKTNLVIIGARPAVGKTALGVSMALNMAKEGKHVGFISSEMSIYEITQRIFAQETGINSHKIRNNLLEQEDWGKLTQSSTRLRNYKIDFYDKPFPKISEVMAICKAWDITEKLDVVIVDYLTRIGVDKKNYNQNLDVGDLAAAFKNMARLLNIPVVVLAQLNRDSAKRADKTPNMSDLRDSGIIEQEADCILLLHRQSEEAIINGMSQEIDEQHYIIIEKNRHGMSGIDLAVNFDKEIGKWH